MFRFLSFVLIGVATISSQILFAEDVKSLGTVYVSVGGDNKLAWFNLDEKGKLQKGGEIMTDTGPGPIAINDKQKILYLGIRGAKVFRPTNFLIRAHLNFWALTPSLETLFT